MTRCPNISSYQTLGGSSHDALAAPEAARPRGNVAPTALIFVSN